ncbi:MAG TPA: BON domain-containing protein [Polyangiaceae bacterium]|nr:BON domain-containing protein [Polyangiaceae bacterium]
MTNADAEIQEAVVRELKWDTRIIDHNLRVSVDTGVVTLTGMVNSYGERVIAQDLAHAVAGVLDVANDIRVVVPVNLRRSDTELAHEVRLALEWDAALPATQIRSTAANGEVTLEGEVESLAQRDDAERAVHHLNGVRIVTNKLAIVPVASLREEVERSLESVLAERAHDDLKSFKLQVANGRVNLSGTVRSWMERQALIDAARRTRGVCSVEANLGIES